MGVGILCGLFLFSSIIISLLENYPMPTCFFFVGLILGSMPLLVKKTLGEEKKLPPVSGFVLFALAMALMYFLSTISDGAGMTQETVLTFGLGAKLFFSAIVAAAAMIVPGVSGSSLLVVFGTYATLYGALSDFNIPMLIPIGLGVVIGLVAGARAIRALLNRFPTHTYCVIVGLVLGSIFVVYPGFALNVMGLISLLTMIVGTLAAYFLGK